MHRLPVWWLIFTAEWRTRPTAVTVPLGLIPAGVAALVLGDDVSQAFTNLGGGAVIRIMGAAMAIGGVLVTVGIFRRGEFETMIGLLFAVFGTTIYGVGVLLGLRLGGLVAGSISLGVSVALVGRILATMRAPHDD